VFVMLRRLACGVLIALLVPTYAASGEPEPTAKGDRLIGLLEVPALWGYPDPDGPPGATLATRPKGPVRLRDAPRPSAKVIAAVVRPDQLQSAEFDYEASAAVAYEARGGWYRIGLAGGGTAWISPEQTFNFHPYERLVIDGLANFTRHWDGVLLSEAAGSKRLAVPPDPERGDNPEYRSVKVHEARRVGDVLWFRLDVVRGSFCDDEPPSVLVSGWVRAHAGNGAPTVWFHSRGC
jgi:hypothetical protein